MSHARQILVGLLVLAAVGPRSGPAQEPTTTDALSTQQGARNIDRVGFPEPSGICYHTLRGTLFVVGDNGDVGEMNTDGTFLRTTRLQQRDLEGITHDPASGLLYVAVEGAEDILELDPETLAVVRAFSIPRKLNGRTVLKKGRGGIEAIAFVPEPAHPEGGTFFVGNQSLDPSSQDDLSAVFEVELPLKTGTRQTGRANLLRYFDAGIDDISDLHYDPASDRLYLISDKADKLLALSRAGKRLQLWHLPGDKQEGFTMDSRGYVYIAQDSGGILRLPWRDLPQLTKVTPPDAVRSADFSRITRPQDANSPFSKPQPRSTPCARIWPQACRQWPTATSVSSARSRIASSRSPDDCGGDLIVAGDLTSERCELPRQAIQCAMSGVPPP